ncbi:MAG: adenine phosphoribosyltransferase [Lentisphaeraceae bacterium]|nr:adenine phosphoribosyltransferase [Lentisphaeraceae bacterium]
MPIDKLKNAIRDVPDFPKEGIIFKDITPILSTPDLFKTAIEQMLGGVRGKKIDKVVGIDARGFLFGTAMAMELGCGIVPARKAGKLPWNTISESYELEYGTATLEMHTDAIQEGDNVLIVDDLLATGGTSLAAAKLVDRLGGNVVDISFFIELAFIPGREKLAGYPVSSILKY